MGNKRQAEHKKWYLQRLIMSQPEKYSMYLGNLALRKIELQKWLNIFNDIAKSFKINFKQCNGRISETLKQQPKMTPVEPNDLGF